MLDTGYSMLDVGCDKRRTAKKEWVGAMGFKEFGPVVVPNEPDYAAAKDAECGKGKRPQGILKSEFTGQVSKEGILSSFICYLSSGI